jgi:UDP-galactose transporter
MGERRDLYECNNNNIHFPLKKALWQLRLIPTACFSQVMLSKYLSLRQWIALVIILAGVICIQQKSPLPSLTSITVDETAAQDYIRMSAIGAVIIAALLASFAGVYLERIFKEENTNLWVANFQLSSFSIAPALVVFIIECSRNNNDYWTPFAAFSSSYWPWITVLIHGCAGIMVALTTKYAGCIAGSISGVASIAFTHLVDITRHSNASLAKETKFFAGFVLVSIGVGSYIYFGRLEKLEHPSNINYKNQDEAIAQEEGLLTMQTMESKVDSNEDDQLPVYEPISGHSTSTATSIPSVH